MKVTQVRTRMVVNFTPAQLRMLERESVFCGIDYSWSESMETCEAKHRRLVEASAIRFNQVLRIPRTKLDEVREALSLLTMTCLIDLARRLSKPDHEIENHIANIGKLYRLGIDMPLPELFGIRVGRAKDLVNELNALSIPDAFGIVNLSVRDGQKSNEGLDQLREALAKPQLTPTRMKHFLLSDVQAILSTACMDMNPKSVNRILLKDYIGEASNALTYIELLHLLMDLKFYENLAVRLCIDWIKNKKSLIINMISNVRRAKLLNIYLIEHMQLRKLKPTSLRTIKKATVGLDAGPKGSLFEVPEMGNTLQEIVDHTPRLNETGLNQTASSKETELSSLTDADATSNWRTAELEKESGYVVQTEGGDILLTTTSPNHLIRFIRNKSWSKNTLITHLRKCFTLPVSLGFLENYTDLDKLIDYAVFLYFPPKAESRIKYLDELVAKSGYCVSYHNDPIYHKDKLPLIWMHPLEIEYELKFNMGIEELVSILQFYFGDATDGHELMERGHAVLCLILMRKYLIADESDFIDHRVIEIESNLFNQLEEQQDLTPTSDNDVMTIVAMDNIVSSEFPLKGVPKEPVDTTEAQHLLTLTTDINNLKFALAVSGKATRQQLNSMDVGAVLRLAATIIDPN